MNVTALDAALAIVCVTVATVFTRAGVLVTGDRLPLSRGVETALRYAPACALSALIVPEILSPTGAIDLSTGNPRWPAALAAALFLLWRPSVAGAIGVGMVVYSMMLAL